MITTRRGTKTIWAGRYRCFCGWYRSYRTRGGADVYLKDRFTKIIIIIIKIICSIEGYYWELFLTNEYFIDLSLKAQNPSISRHQAQFKWSVNSTLAKTRQHIVSWSLITYILTCILIWVNTFQLTICHVAISLTFVCPSKLFRQKAFHQDRQKSLWCPRWDNLSGVKGAAHWTAAESFDGNCTFKRKWKNRRLKSVESCFRALLMSGVSVSFFSCSFLV